LFIKALNSKSLSLNEAKALAIFSNNDENPYIVRFFNAWIESEHLYLVVKNLTILINPYKIIPLSL